MVPVHEAERIIMEAIKNYGTETVSFQESMGRILAENVLSDRDLPPFNRVAMDGIAIRFHAFEKGTRTFRVAGMQAAGASPLLITHDEECIEIMTGAALPPTVDTVIRYEDIILEHGYATVDGSPMSKGQHIHFRGQDKRQGEVVVQAPRQIDAAVISMLASVGKQHIEVKKLPRIVIISTGDELKDMSSELSDVEIRQSNNHTIHAILRQYNIEPVMIHITDQLETTQKRLEECVQSFDVILMTGGISMGKLDYVPKALENAGVEKKFHKVEQRPGKPFWFGVHPGGSVVFAFPGNPVSTFMCVHRYFLPWLERCLGIHTRLKLYAVLAEDFTFAPPLQYFLQVRLSTQQDGKLVAIPAAGNGSGDFANLTETDAFMELPSEETIFKAGDAFRIWPFRQWF